MGRLYTSLLVLFLVFSTAMSFVTLGVYNLQWWWSVLGVGILLVFVALGGLLVPGAQKALAPEQRKTANTALQAFGALCAAEVFIMALVSWVVGNRTLYQNNAYQVLGLLIFLGLLAVGVQGVLVTLARFVYIRNRTWVESGGTVKV